MDENIRGILEKYSPEINELYENLRTLIYESIAVPIEEKLWAKLPSYYVGENVVRFIPFKDHINVEASAVIQHKDKLTGYKITPKGLLQIYLEQAIPNDVIKEIFHETLKG